MRLLFLVISISCLFATCKNRTYTPQNLPDNYILFGSSGGFSGATNSYYLFPNGKLFKMNSLFDSGQYKELKRVSKREYKNVLGMLHKQNILNLKLNETGNMTYFITLKNKKERTWQWGSGSGQKHEEIEHIYKSLTQLTTSKS